MAIADASRWYELTNLTATPVLNKWGTLFDDFAVTRPREFWMPSCAMSGQGHMAIITSAAREGTGVTEPAGEYAGIAASGRFANDPTGGPGNLVTPSPLQSPIIAQAGGGAYNLDDGSNPRHWGDYSSVTVDPMDDMTFWSVHEYLQRDRLVGCACYSIQSASAGDAICSNSIIRGARPDQRECRDYRDIFWRIGIL